MDIFYVNTCIATMYEEAAGTEKEAVSRVTADEALYGTPVLALKELGRYVKVRTHYGYEGYVKKEVLIQKDAIKIQMVVNGIYVDVLEIPKVQGAPLISLTRGCLIEVSEEECSGYRKVFLLDGREGYIPAKYLTEKLFDTSRFEQGKTMPSEAEFQRKLRQLIDSRFGGKEENFREAVTKTALSYLGANYRWGGKTMLGIDCSGLTSMSYMLNGVLTYRDARIMPGYPVKEITREEMKKGDLIYFKGHIAMYLGDGLYVHSTARTGSNGVDINSLCKEDPRYRKDLDEGLLKAGTIFW